MDAFDQYVRQLCPGDPPIFDVMLLGLGEGERRWQVDRLLGHPLFRSGAEHPTLIVGDFNDWRDALHAGTLAAEGFRQVTSPPSAFRSFPAWLPLGSLDKAFARGVEIGNARVVRTSLTRVASDHLPLVVDFHLA